MSKVIPSLPPLSSIQDPNVRQAIEALSTGWRVRNGEVGDGAEKFLTANDLDGMIKNFQIGVTNTLGDGTNGGLGNAPPTNRWIGSLLARIDAAIAQSYLYRKLGDRIDWIDTPEWFQGKFGAAIREETIIRENQNSALASQITTAVTNINGNIALIQEELTATSDLAGATARSVTQLQTDIGGVKTTAQNALSLASSIDGTVRGAWTVKFDANGYVTGAGLGLEGKDGHYSSSFYVRADRFAVGNPEYPGVVPRIPFKVFSTQQTLPDGTVVPPGVYMDEATVYKLTGTYISAGSLDAGEIYTGSTWLDRISKQPILSQASGQWNGSVYDGERIQRSSLRFYGSNFHASSPLRQRVRNSTYGGPVVFIVSATATADHWMSIWYRINGSDYWVPPVNRYIWQMEVSDSWNNWYWEYGFDTYGATPVVPNVIGQTRSVQLTDGNGDPYEYTFTIAGQRNASVFRSQNIDRGYTASTVPWQPIAMTTEPQPDYGSIGVSGSITLNVGDGYYVDFCAAARDSAGSVYNWNAPHLYDLSITVSAINV